MSSKGSFFSRLSGSTQTVSTDPYYDEADVAAQEQLDIGDGEAQLSVDLLDRGNEIILQTIIAGVHIEDIDITISRTHVTIRGFRENPFEDSFDRIRYFNQELFWGPFSREVDLPDEIDIDKVEAVEDHGLLTIKMPKSDKERINKVKIK